MILKLGTLPTQYPDILGKPGQPKPEGFDFADLVKDHKPQETPKTDNQNPNHTEQASDNEAQKDATVSSDSTTITTNTPSVKIAVEESAPETEMAVAASPDIAAPVEGDVEASAEAAPNELQPPMEGHIVDDSVSVADTQATENSEQEVVDVFPAPIAAPNIEQAVNTEPTAIAAPVEAIREAAPSEIITEEAPQSSPEAKADLPENVISKPEIANKADPAPKEAGNDVQATNIPTSQENDTRDAQPKTPLELKGQLEMQRQKASEETITKAQTAPAQNIKPEVVNPQNTDTTEIVAAPAPAQEVAEASTSEQNLDNNNLPAKEEMVLESKLDNQPPKFAHIHHADSVTRPSNVSAPVSTNDASPKPVLEQVSDHILSITSKANIAEGETITTIDLKPGDLGQVRVELVVKDNLIREIRLSAKEPETLRLLQEGEAQLSRELEQVTASKDASLQFNLQGQNHKQQDPNNMLDFWSQMNDESGQKPLAPTKNSVYDVAGAAANAEIYNPSEGRVYLAL